MSIAAGFQCWPRCIPRSFNSRPHCLSRWFSSQPRFISRRFWQSAAVALGFVAAFTAHAASFTANPVRLTLPSGSNSTSLSLDNTGDQPVLVQAEVMAWTQQDGSDVLTPSQDLVVSPPIFNVAPGGRQIVRLGLLRPVAGEREVTYRLFLQEVAQPPAPGEQGVAVALRLGLPVFVLPKGRAAPHLAWRAKAEEGAIRLTLTNSGNAHVQAIDCKMYRQDGLLFAEQQLAGYVLAGQARSWLIKPKQPWRGEKLRLTANTNLGEVAVELSSD